jgi:hypothetical protein
MTERLERPRSGPFNSGENRMAALVAEAAGPMV